MNWIDDFKSGFKETCFTVCIVRLYCMFAFKRPQVAQLDNQCSSLNVAQMHIMEYRILWIRILEYSNKKIRVFSNI